MRSNLDGLFNRAHYILSGEVDYAVQPHWKNRKSQAISDFTAEFRGENDSHILGLSGGKWHCNCHFFTQWGECVHIMTLQRLLGKMLPQVDSGKSI